MIYSFQYEANVDRLAYLTHRSYVYEYARDYDGQLATYEEILEIGGDRGLVLRECAVVEVQRGNISEARRFFEQARNKPLKAILEHADAMIEGMLLVEEGAPADAIPLLEGALISLESRPIYQILSIALTRGYLALALASTGDTEHAQPLFEQALPLLQDRGYDRLLDRSRAALDHQ